MDFEIKYLNRNTIHDQLTVYRLAFNSPKDDDVWVKKHYENPLGDSLVFGAYHEGKLVGMNSYMPVEYQYNGKTISMLQSCESGVIPEYQGKGIWSKVVRYAIEYIFRETKYQAVIGFPNYINSYPGFKKMGWETLFGMDNYVMVNNSKEFSKNIFKRKKVLQNFGCFLTVQRLAVWLAGRGYKRFAVGDCEFSELYWDDNPNVFSVTHTDDLLKWKESYKQIKCISIRKDGNPIASCIFSCGDYEGAQIIKIEKCVLSSLSPISQNRAIALFAKYFAKNYPNVAFLRVWAMPDSSLAFSLKQLLFMKSSHPNPFIIKQGNIVFSDKNWNLSFFDLD